MTSRRQSSITWLALGLLATGLGAQAVSDAPLLNFRLPVFNALGFRIWDLSSGTVRTLERDRFELTTVHLRMLAGDEASTLEGELFTPAAEVDQGARTISGTGQLHVITRGVELFGDDWIYDGNDRSIVIKRNVVVTFAGDLGNILQ